jgi:hypothetical protein
VRQSRCCLRHGWTVRWWEILVGSVEDDMVEDERTERFEEEEVTEITYPALGGPY